MKTPPHIVKSIPYQQALRDLQKYIFEVSAHGGAPPTLKEIQRDFIAPALRPMLHEKV